MSQNLFEIALRITEREGDWSDDPQDTGGATRYGATLKYYNKWKFKDTKELTYPVLTKEEFKLVPRGIIAQYFVEEYWPKALTTYLADTPMAEIIFDFAVMADPKDACRIFQRALNAMNPPFRQIKVDGAPGKITTNAFAELMRNRPYIQQCCAMIHAIADQRILHHCECIRDGKSKPRFIVGWVNRAINVKLETIQRAEDMLKESN
jgi:lysozyme family protein